MGLTRLCLKNPVAVAVTLAVIALLGVLSISRLPVQLFPNIERPEMGVWTGWRAASPREVESEIIEPIERELRGLPGVKTMQSWSNSGGGFVRLQFALDTDMDAAFTEVTSRLQRVQGLPAEADRPAITFNGGGNSGETLIFLFLQRLPGVEGKNVRLSDFARERIAPEIEAVPGVGGVEVNSDDGEDIVRIAFDPFLAAQLGVTLDQITQTVNRSSDITGGSVDVGRRSYTMRFEGRFNSDQMENTILAWRGNAPIRLGDIATVAVEPYRSTGVVYQNGNPAIGMNVYREPGANTLVAINALTEKLDELNNGPLKDMGYAIHKSFDPSLFIKQALALLTGNLLAGVFLAVGVLWLFIRRVAATLLIASAIPVCLAATIVFLNIAGRSINVISLAGLAFATGMVLDAAIVVMENFVRMREEGRDPMSAAGLAVSQVFGALFASTVTTIAIFVPILFFEDVEGQLFADLALTIAVAVAVSLIVAVTVLPTGAAHLMTKDRVKPIKATTRLVDRVSDLVMTLTSTPRRRWAWIAGLTVAPVALGFALFPSMNYLPPVKRAAIDGFVGLPSGASPDYVREEIAEVIIKRLEPYMKGEKDPALLNYYVYAGPWGANIGVRAKDVAKLDQLNTIVNEEILAGFPDTRVFAQQGDLFGNFGGGAWMRIELQAADFDALAESVPAAIDIIQAAVPGSSVWPNPDPQVVTPEIRILPNDRRIAEVGMTRDAVARAVRAFGDGMWLGEFFHQDGRLDVILQANSKTTPETVGSIPIATPSGAVVPLSELATVGRSVGPQQIRRLDGRRTIALNINTPKEIPLSDVMKSIRDKAEAELYAALPAGASIKYAGEADSLNRAVANLSANFGLAICILFLILSALFKSARDAALVIIALPMAAVGGVAAIRVLNLVTATPLDLLGMIGFIIMLGLVVNNAILLVAQARESEKDGLDRRSAVMEALKLRIRPIFLTTLTSIMGMLPLVVAPGAGAGIYRGLAAVIVGGMAVSTLFTLILLPSLLQIGAARRRETEASGPILQPAE